jgi:hypothetical protein
MKNGNLPDFVKTSSPGRSRGTSMAEMPMALWLMVMCIAFPLIILVTMSIRYGLFWNAAREAVQKAAQCQTYQIDPPATIGGSSSVNTAQQVTAQACASISGISLVSPAQVYIVQVPLATAGASGSSTSIGPNTKLTGPADCDNYIYQLQVILKGQIAPLVPLPVGVFGPIPGLTMPFPITVKAQQQVEDVQSLNE